MFTWKHTLKHTVLARGNVLCCCNIGFSYLTLGSEYFKYNFECWYLEKGVDMVTCFSTFVVFLVTEKNECQQLGCTCRIPTFSNSFLDHLAVCADQTSMLAVFHPFCNSSLYDLVVSPDQWDLIFMISKQIGNLSFISVTSLSARF